MFTTVQSLLPCLHGRSNHASSVITDVITITTWFNWRLFLVNQKVLSTCSKANSLKTTFIANNKCRLIRIWGQNKNHNLSLLHWNSLEKMLKCLSWYIALNHYAVYVCLELWLKFMRRSLFSLAGCKQPIFCQPIKIWLRYSEVHRKKQHDIHTELQPGS